MFDWTMLPSPQSQLLAEMFEIKSSIAAPLKLRVISISTSY